MTNMKEAEAHGNEGNRKIYQWRCQLVVKLAIETWYYIDGSGRDA